MRLCACIRLALLLLVLRRPVRVPKPRLRLEPLEDRTLPASTLSWSPPVGLKTANWSTPSNWRIVAMDNVNDQTIGVRKGVIGGTANFAPRPDDRLIFSSGPQNNISTDDIALPGGQKFGSLWIEKGYKGVIRLDRAITVGNMVMMAGTITGQALTISSGGKLTWIDGSMQGPGETTIADKATLLLQGDNAAELPSIHLAGGRRLIINGTAQWTNGKILLGGAGITVKGSFQATSSKNLTMEGGTGQTTGTFGIESSGTFQVDMAAPTLTVNLDKVWLTHGGNELSVTVGNLILNKGAAFTSPVRLGGGGKQGQITFDVGSDNSHYGFALGAGFSGAGIVRVLSRRTGVDNKTRIGCDRPYPRVQAAAARVGWRHPS